MIRWLFLFASLAASASAPANDYRFDPVHTQVLFAVDANSVIWVVSEVVNGSVGTGSVSVEDEVYLSWEPCNGVLVS